MMNNISTIRAATVAGQFYPDNPDSLKSKIKEYLSLENNNIYTDSDIFGLVVPHAGYTYSGYIAGEAYKELIGRKYDVIVIISPSHTKFFQGSCVYNGEAYLTPLSPLFLDKDFCYELCKQNNNVYLGTDGHDWEKSRSEHALEVQLPFIQTVLPDVKIVPIIMGSQDPKSINDLTTALYKTIKLQNKKVLVIASSDLSHFHNSEEAEELDSRFIDSFENFDYFKIQSLLSQKLTEACGGGPIQVMMMVGESLGYQYSSTMNSGTSADSQETPTDDSRVVGYFSGIVYKDENSEELLPEFNDLEKKEIIRFTKKVINNKILKSNDSTILDLSCDSYFGMFVTIKKNNELRACMGHLLSLDNFQDELKSIAELTATQDYRFGALKESELGEYQIEISFLSRFKRIFDINKIEIGKHGLYIKYYNEKQKNYSSGLLLPQVATEHKLNRTSFLQNLSKKASLDKDSYLDDNAELYIFEAEIITE